MHCIRHCYCVCQCICRCRCLVEAWVYVREGSPMISEFAVFCHGVPLSTWPMYSRVCFKNMQTQQTKNKNKNKRVIACIFETRASDFWKSGSGKVDFGDSASWLLFSKSGLGEFANNYFDGLALTLFFARLTSKLNVLIFSFGGILAGIPHLNTYIYIYT